jgi:hypothetical protein
MCAIVELMCGVRRFIRSRWSGGLLAFCVAYSLTIQALMVSVGLSMSAAVASGHSDFVICSFAAGLNAGAPADGSGQKPAPRPQCPFCFVAAQSAGDAATVGETPAFPAYAGVQIAGGISSHVGDGNFVPQFRRTAGEPRAPPLFSV